MRERPAHQGLECHGHRSHDQRVEGRRHRAVLARVQVAAEQLGEDRLELHPGERRAQTEVRTAAAEDGLEGGRHAAHELLNSSEHPTAIVCVNDFMAVGVLRYLRERGILVHCVDAAPPALAIAQLAAARAEPTERRHP